MANGFGRIRMPDFKGETDSPGLLPPASSNLEEEKKQEIVPTTARNLLHLRTIFPLRVFLLEPHELIIDEIKVSVVYHYFWETERVVSIFIKDLTRVIVEHNPWFAVLKLITTEFKDFKLQEGETLAVKQLLGGYLQLDWLWKNDAMRARSIVEGLMILTKEKKDTSKMAVGEVLLLAEELGRAR